MQADELVKRMGIERANSRTTRFRRDLVLLNMSLLIVGLTISLLIVGLLIFEEWQRQVDAFHLSIKECAESHRTPERSD